MKIFRTLLQPRRTLLIIPAAAVAAATVLFPGLGLAAVAALVVITAIPATA